MPSTAGNRLDNTSCLVSAKNMARDYGTEQRKSD